MKNKIQFSDFELFAVLVISLVLLSIGYTFNELLDKEANPWRVVVVFVTGVFMTKLFLYSSDSEKKK